MKLRITTVCAAAAVAMTACLTTACGGDEPEPEPPVQPVVPEPDVPDDPENPNPPVNPFTPTDEQIAGAMAISTGGVPIESKEEYVPCTVTLTHSNSGWNLTEVTGGIRGRGNSTWLWYDKKPYRIKFDKKQTVMGLGKAKSWVLLAEYRDPTDLMNAFVFELGQLMQLPYTNHNRYVEVTLNGENIGLYHLTEQVQQGDNRVAVDEAAGILMQLDADDGPELAPDATDNFWSDVYRLPVCVKNPEDQTKEQLNGIKQQLATLESAIRHGNYADVEANLDVRSMIDFLIVQELIYNVELAAPRSMYMHKHVDGKWTMGPLWDFDAGFDFRWSDMYTGHHYFDSYRELVLGTDPANYKGTSYSCSAFFTQLFAMRDFVSAYKARWAEVYPLVNTAWQNALGYYKANTGTWQREAELWPIGYDYAEQVEQLEWWIGNRAVYLDRVVTDLPAGR